MKINLKSLGVMLLLCVAFSLLAVSALATGGEDTALQSEVGLTGPTDGTSAPTDGDPADGDPADGDPADGDPTDGGPAESGYSITFYGCTDTEPPLHTISNHANGVLSEDEKTALSTALSGKDVLFWLYGTDADHLTSSCTAEALYSLNLEYSNYVFYAAFCVNYYNGTTLLTSEIVKPGEKPTNAPTTAGELKINSWTDAAENGSYIVPADTAISANTNFYAVLAQPEPQTVKVTFLDYDGTQLGSQVNVTIGSKLTTEQIPKSASKNATVEHWISESGGQSLERAAADLTTIELNADTTFRAAWQVSYVYFSNGTETVLQSALVLDDSAPTGEPEKIGSKTIAGWTDAGGASVKLSDQKITADVSFAAWVNPELNTSSSVAYVKGISDKNNNTYYFQPDVALTRAMAAQLVYGLLDTTEMGPISASFSDVPDSAWYATAIKTLASYGLLTGTEDGKFEPTRGITRAEFVQMICNLRGIQKTSDASPFADVTELNAKGERNWYYDAIMTAYKEGWITGYKQSNGTVRFERQRKITRAEAVAILNRIIGRTVKTDSAAQKRIDGYNWRLFVDLADSHWAYYEVMEAVTGCGSSIPKTGLSAGRHKIKANGVYQYFFVNSDGRFTAVKKGLNVMSDGKSYYFAANGAGARVYSAGVYSLGGDLYLLDSEGTVIREPRSGYDTRVYEYNNRMYYIQTDGTLLQDEKFGYLYFGSNGAFTTGDRTLDAWLNNFVSEYNLLSSSYKTQEDKLRAAYVAVRDFPLDRYGYGSAGYSRYNLSGYTHQEHASFFFERAKGTCEDWAYAMVYLAQRIGYDACAAVGKIQGSNYAVHVWEHIYIRDNWYTFDVEQEWGYMYQYYSSRRSDRDCFKMKYDDGNTVYYGTRYAGTTYGNDRAGTYNVWSPYLFSYFTT